MLSFLRVSNKILTFARKTCEDRLRFSKEQALCTRLTLSLSSKYAISKQ